VLQQVFFTGRMPFLSPNQERREGKKLLKTKKNKS